MSKHKQPRAYTAPHDVYTAGQYTRAGEVFVTDAPKGKDWEPRDPEEAHIIDAAQNEVPGDPPLESLDVAALRALAVTKHVNTDGMGKKQLIDAIKAANEPRL